jgi:DNA-binding IclR family transcriptional regulator
MESARDITGMEILAKADVLISTLSERGEMSAAELADAVGEPASSTYRLLTSLIGIGWVAFGTQRGQYRLGYVFMRVGAAVEESVDIRERALPTLRELLQTTGETSYLCIRRGARAVCIERLDGPGARSLELRLGASLPLAVGGAPRAILAFLPEEERRSLTAESLADAASEGRHVDPDELEEELALTRQQGFSISDGDVTAGVGAIGAPIFNQRHELVGAVSISGIREHLLGASRDRIISLIVSGAETISGALGDSPKGNQ